MKRRSAVALLIATAAFTLLIARIAPAQAAPCNGTQPFTFNGGYNVGIGDYRISCAAATEQSMPTMPSNDNSSPEAMQQAVEMVPAQAILDRTIDARKVKEGDQIQATLLDKVQLKDGTELPSGTELTGQVTLDQAQNDGTYRLALVFTNAQLKQGTVVPIEATIVKIDGPAAFQSSGGYNVAIGDYRSWAANAWTAQTTQVDQPDALAAGVDFQSRIAGENSGNFSSKKNDIKLSDWTVLDLAIAGQGKS